MTKFKRNNAKKQRTGKGFRSSPPPQTTAEMGAEIASLASAELRALASYRATRRERRAQARVQAGAGSREDWLIMLRIMQRCGLLLPTADLDAVVRLAQSEQRRTLEAMRSPEEQKILDEFRTGFEAQARKALGGGV